MALSSLTASATLPPRYRQWSSLLRGFSGRKPTRLSFGASPKRKGDSGFVACGASVENAGFAAAISEAESPQRLYSWPDNKKPRICILGGGFGGLYTALRLESLVWPDEKRPQVLLVDQYERFCFKPMLYELLSGEVDKWEIAPRFTDLLASTSVLFFQDKVKSLHPLDHFATNGTAKSACGGSIRLESGLLIEYDCSPWTARLVLALGAETKLDLVPGAADFALPFSTLEDALRVDLRLKTLERSNFGKKSLIRVTVVGCGYAGVELAATIAERLQGRGTVQAINSEMTICSQASPGNREVAMKILSTRKVELLLGYFVRSISRVETATGEDSIGQELEKYVLDLQPSERGMKGEIVETDLVLWTVGSKPLLPETEPRERQYELPVNARGQTETDETLRVKGHPRIFAVGDSSSLRDSNGKLLPATAQVAFQQADFAGWNLWAAINNRPLLPFRFQNLGEMMTLGRSDAALSPSFIDGLTIEGPIGHTARKLAYLARLPTDEHRLKVGASWSVKTAIDSISFVQSTLFKILSGS